MVTVLVAAYNGEKYLGEQLASLERQTFKDFKVIISDDGSKDKTPEIIADFKIRHPNSVEVITGEPSGSSKENFFRLMNVADDDYVMLCDQDDVWFDDKIERTLSKMRETEEKYPEKPVLVHGDLCVTDGDLQVKDKSFFHFQAISPERSALNNLLVQNNVTGCTLMMNRALLSLAKQKPEVCAMHDNWIALVACLFGVTEYIDEPLMYYRQHGDNQVGAKPARGIDFIINKYKNRKRTRHNYIVSFAQARCLFKLFGSYMTESQKETVEAYASLENGTKFSKIKTIKKYDFRKNTKLRTLGQYFSI